MAGASFTGTGQFKFALIAQPGGASLWSNNGTSVNGSEPGASISRSGEQAKHEGAEALLPGGCPRRRFAQGPAQSETHPAQCREL